MTRKKERVVPIVTGRMGIYTCGPTVYHHAHLGNLRTYIAADVLVRVLRHSGLVVTHVMNITDVGHLTSDADEGEDKLEVGSKREGRSAWDIAEHYTNSFFEQTTALQVSSPNIVCKATDHIAQQIAMIEALSNGDYTYRTDDGLYFDTSKDRSYGALAHLDIDGLKPGIRVNIGGKRNKTDFAVWKFSPPDQKRQMEWESPWGMGFPGWHIECSAMSTHYLGNQIDIHTGGIDHIPVHHTNEIAQCECATHEHPFVKYWFHSNFLHYANSAKMSKSSGDFLTVFDLIERGFDPLAFRFLCLKAHYRSEVKFSWDLLQAAATHLNRLRNQVHALLRHPEADGAPSDLTERGQRFQDRFDLAVADDLATPEALSVLQEALASSLPAADKLSLLRRWENVLAIGLFQPVRADDVTLPENVQTLVDERAAVRLAKDFARSDQLRRELAELGYDVVDEPGGTQRVVEGAHAK